MTYQYELDLLTEHGEPLERAVVTPDWGPALAWVHFEGVRAGRLPAETRAGCGVVEPIWDRRLGAPRVAGFRVTVRARDGRQLTRDLPTAYVRSLAQQRAADLVARGGLAPGSLCRWIVSAAAGPDEAMPAVDDGALDVEDLPAPLPIDAAALAPFVGRAVFAGDDPEAHVPVFLPESILDQTKALARRSPDVETGGILLGKLHRDAGAGGRCGELFVEITTQLPAVHTRAERTRLTFTAATWATARAAVAEREGTELMVGWWHSHLPLVWCERPDAALAPASSAPPESRQSRSYAIPFLSGEDVHLHATCFPSGHQIALLISDDGADGLTASVFGWFEGMIVARGYHVLHAARDDRRASTPTLVACAASTLHQKGAEHADNTLP